MNCRDFQKQFEVGSSLNDSAKTHLKICENCRAFEQKELNLTQIFQSLPKVEAPKDFGFRLNAYIAKTEKVKRPLPAVWQTLRFGLPLAAAVLIFGFIIFNSNLFTSDNQNLQTAKEDSNPVIREKFENNLPEKNNDLSSSEITENGKANVEDKITEPTIKSEKSNNNVGLKETTKVKQTVEKAKTVKKIDKSIEKDFSGSKDFASRQPEVLLPQNNSGYIKNTETEFAEKRKQLLEIGISTEDENWKINKVMQESIAEKSGVQIGDVIVEINKIPVSAQIPQSENVKTKSLKILRDKNIVNINLVN